jgi:SH3-like domain-containing protein
MTFIVVLSTAMVCAVLSSYAQAQTKNTQSAFEQKKIAAQKLSGMPIPRFVSLMADESNVRTGPGRRYPIKWKYQARDYPVEIIQEFEHWRKIKDIDGDTGWIHKSLLSGKRFVLIQADDLVKLYKKPKKNKIILAYVEPLVIAQLDSCTQDFCAVNMSGYSGWIARKFIYGVYDNEKFD